jgi:hypothetical protein
MADTLGRPVRDQSLVFTDKDFRNRRADCRINAPIDRLPVGQCLLSIDAAMEKHTAQRAVRPVVQ